MAGNNVFGQIVESGYALKLAAICGLWLIYMVGKFAAKVPISVV